MLQPALHDGLTFDDVLLVPKRSAINSRREVSLTTSLSERLKLRLPILAAPMDTVCESAMAIAMARLGAIGVIHRFNTIERQVAEVNKVKRVENYFLENPHAVGPYMTVRDLRARASEVGTSSFLVVGEDGVLLGLISKRDYIFEENGDREVQELMTPFSRLICVHEFITLPAAKELFKKHKVEKLPVVNDVQMVRGLITAKDVIQSSNTNAVRDAKGRLLVGAALGVKSDVLERAHALVMAGADLLVLDIAHGHLDMCLETVRKIKKAFPSIPLVAGNVATRDGARDLKEAGADIVKVGVGPGAVCTTRIVTGCGVPQLTAIMEAKKGAGETPVIADGGIRNSGDMVKALAAGASAIMIGSLFAGTDEAPGKVAMWNGRKVKLYRGMASYAAYENKAKRVDNEEVEDYTAEGVDQAFVSYKGGVTDILRNLEGGMRSGFSYCGAKSLVELWGRAEFIRVSAVGIRENGAHDVLTA